MNSYYKVKRPHGKPVILMLMEYEIYRIYFGGSPLLEPLGCTGKLVDKWQSVMATTKNDTVKLAVLVKLAYYSQNFQQVHDLSDKALAL